MALTRNIVSGAMFIAVGSAFLYLSLSGYVIWQGSKAGPGAFPMLCSIGMIAVGVISIGVGFFRDEPVARIHLFPIFVLGFALVLFALLIERAGALVTLPLTIVVASLARPDMRWEQRLMLALGVTAVCVLVFSHLLSVPFPLLPDFG